MDSNQTIISIKNILKHIKSRDSLNEFCQQNSKLLFNNKKSISAKISKLWIRILHRSIKQKKKVRFYY